MTHLYTMIFQSPLDMSQQAFFVPHILSIDAFCMGNPGVKRIFNVPQNRPPSPYANPYLDLAKCVFVTETTAMCTVASMNAFLLVNVQQSAWNFCKTKNKLQKIYLLERG